MKVKCVTCGADANVVREDYNYAEVGLKNVYLKGVEILRCEECGEEAVRIPRLNDLMRAIATAVVFRPGRLSGEEVRFLRKHLGMSAERFGEVLGVDKTTISKWENDVDPIGPQSDRLIRITALALGDGMQGKVKQLLDALAEILAQRRKPPIAVDTKTMEYSYAA